MANRSPDLRHWHRSLIRNSNAARRDGELGIGPPNDVPIAPGGDIAAIGRPLPVRAVGGAVRVGTAEATEPGVTRQAWAHGAPAPERAARLHEALTGSGPPGRFSAGPVNVPKALNPDHIQQRLSAAFTWAKAERFSAPGCRAGDAVSRSEGDFARTGYLAIAGCPMAPEQISGLHRQCASSLNRLHKAPGGRPVLPPSISPQKAVGTLGSSRQVRAQSPVSASAHV